VSVRRLAVLLSLAVALVAPAARGAAAAAAPKGVPAGAQEARVWGYLDGGAFRARLGGKTEVVALLGVDAPDAKAKECFAAESAAHLRGLLPKKATVYLERDRDDRDGQGRLPRFAWIVGAKGGKAVLVNTKQVRDGYAKVGNAAPSGRYASNLAKADQQAQAAARGLWGACYAPDGEWAGATAGGDPISFTVKYHGMSVLAVAVSCATANGYVTFHAGASFPVPRPLGHDAFSVTFGGGGRPMTTLAGSFLSPTEARGTLEVVDPAGPCGSPLTTTWSATRQG
jgi:endonuclease YncB( thermonuclease family)